MTKAGRCAAVAGMVFCVMVSVQAAGPAPKRVSRQPVVADMPVATPQAEGAELTPQQLALSERVALGRVPCELSNYVQVSAHPQHAGHFVVEMAKQHFVMVPVVTSTGAIRLEDVQRGAVWLQLANKSMLMDQKKGKRLADACMNAEQANVAQALERTPAAHLLEPLPKERASLVGATN